MTLALPEPFVRTVTQCYAHGADWLAQLPTQLARLAATWELTVESADWPLSYNYVVPCRHADGSAAVLKIGPPNDELTAEMATLTFWNGRGAARVFRTDQAEGALLLERLHPGTMLSTLWPHDDDTATLAAADVMEALWQPAPADLPLPDLVRWTRGLSELRPHYGGGTGPFPEHLVAKAEGLLAELLASQAPAVVLHGDLHHHNILRTADRWLAIDPKGLLGEPAYELGALLRNPLGFTDHADAKAQTRRRCDLLCERLSLDRERVIGYALAQAVLSAWWDITDDTPTPDLTLAHWLEELHHALFHC